MDHHNHNENLKVGNGAGKGRADNIKDRFITPPSHVRQRSLRSVTKFSSIDEESDLSQRMEGSNIDQLSVSAKFTTLENDQSLLRPMRQQSLRSLFDVSEKSVDTSQASFDKFSVASAKFGLPDEANNLPIYCPMRQISQNMNCSLNEISTIGESYRSNDTWESYRSNGVDESNRSTASELPGMS